MRYINEELKNIAKKVRKNILTMSLHARSAHTGGALSCVEILVILYFEAMRVFPRNWLNPRRDRLIFSKAHDAKALYSVLAERGFFDHKILTGYELNDGLLPGHSTRFCVAGVEASAGSLGHGLPIAAGVAFAGKLAKKSYYTYAILSDGECDEGSTWEAALFAGHHKLDNLIVIIDYNKLQGFGYVKDVLELEPFGEKWKAFGWDVAEVNGHDFDNLRTAISKARENKVRPQVIIAHTIKGLGGVEKHIDKVSSQYLPPTDEEYQIAIKKLDKK